MRWEPRGEHWLADVIGSVSTVAKVTTGEIEETLMIGKAPDRTWSGKVGGSARAQKLTAEERSRIAKKAAEARWG